jgi:hypothetical protein
LPSSKTISFYVCDEVINFKKLFDIIYVMLVHIALSFESGYAAGGINYAKKVL